MKTNFLLVCTVLCFLATSCTDLSKDELEMQNTENVKYEIDNSTIKATGDDDGNRYANDDDEIF